MLYNKELKRTPDIKDCYNCPHFDKKKKHCNGLNSTCFEYDEKTKTVIDGITKLPIQL